MDDDPDWRAVVQSLFLRILSAYDAGFADGRRREAGIHAAAGLGDGQIERMSRAILAIEARLRALEQGGRE